MHRTAPAPAEAAGSRCGSRRCSGRTAACGARRRWTSTRCTRSRGRTACMAATGLDFRSGLRLHRAEFNIVAREESHALCTIVRDQAPIIRCEADPTAATLHTRARPPLETTTSSASLKLARKELIWSCAREQPSSCRRPRDPCVPSKFYDPVTTLHNPRHAVAHSGAAARV